MPDEEAQDVERLPFLLPQMLRPNDVRLRGFNRPVSRRDAVSLAEVKTFNYEIADNLAVLHTEVRRLRDENERLQAMLRNWQVNNASKSANMQPGTVYRVR